MRFSPTTFLQAMGSPKSSSFELQIYLVLTLVVASSAQLSSTFYQTTCPDALSTIRQAVADAIANEQRMGASLLRLHFHDCFVNGCDGSVLLDDNSTFTGEKTSILNKNSIRGFDVIDTIKSSIESVCPGVVSCADILAVAARDSVVALGGPSWTVKLGRRDALTASLSATDSDLPTPIMSLSELITSFSNKGFSETEMVVLSGAHTIGQTRCTSFRSRIYNETTMDSTYATSLKSNCPSEVGVGDDNLAALDAGSQFPFDKAYFTNLMNFKGILHSDQQLYGNQSTDSVVSGYSASTSSFFTDFANAMIKMGDLSPLTGTNGEVRINCRKAN